LCNLREICRRLVVKLYPIMLNLSGKRVVVVGGGRVALRKITSLLETGAIVAVISPQLVDELSTVVRESMLDWVPEPFEESMLDQFTDTELVFGATNKRDVNVRIHNAARSRRIPCNIADVPDLCTFIVPAVISQGDLTVAVTTGGSSPALARRIREDLEKLFGPEYAEMIRVMGELRKQVLSTGSPSDENKKIFMHIVDSGFLDALRDNDREKALEILRAILPEGVNPHAAIDHPRACNESS
jgi:precorrin-2 dehydrogenase / sirohydrochlorin ferrochelatase